MLFAKWRNGVLTLIWIHIISLVINTAIYGSISFSIDAPFLTIFRYREAASYYLTTYAFVLIFTFTFCGMGLVFGDIFGHKDFRAQLVSRGMLVIGILGSLIPLIFITMWNLTLQQTDLNWTPFVMAAQYFGKWIAFVTILIFVGTTLLLFFLAREHASVPNEWGNFSLVLAAIGLLIAISCLWIPLWIMLLRIVYLIGAVCYLIWAIWLATLIKKVERMH